MNKKLLVFHNLTNNPKSTPPRKFYYDFKKEKIKTIFGMFLLHTSASFLAFLKEKGKICIYQSTLKHCKSGTGKHIFFFMMTLVFTNNHNFL